MRSAFLQFCLDKICGFDTIKAYVFDTGILAFQFQDGTISSILDTLGVPGICLYIRWNGRLVKIIINKNPGNASAWSVISGKSARRRNEVL